MIAVVFASATDEAQLGAALSGLVPAAMDGLVGSVTLAGGPVGPGVALIAEDMGAEVCAGGVEEACAAAKGEWLMILPAPVALVRGWEAAVEAFVARAPGAARLRADGMLAALTGGADGLLIERALYEAAGGWQDSDDSRKLLARVRRSGGRTGDLRILERR